MPNDISLLEKIYDKVEALDNRVDDIDKTLTRQEVNLREHMRRSEAAENGIEILKKELINLHKEEIQPIKDHVLLVKKIGKIITWILFSSGLLIWVLDKSI